MIAANTVAGTKPTWTGTRGRTHRLDYIGLPMNMQLYHDNIHKPDFDLAPGVRDDHDLLTLDLCLGDYIRDVVAKWRHWSVETNRHLQK